MFDSGSMSVALLQASCSRLSQGGHMGLFNLPQGGDAEARF